LTNTHGHHIAKCFDVISVTSDDGLIVTRRWSEDDAARLVLVSVLVGRGCPPYLAKDAPSGTLGLDQAGRKYGWDKDTLHGIKDEATGGMAGGKTWVGVAPNGVVGVNEGGRWAPQGHYSGLKP